MTSVIVFMYHRSYSSLMFSMKKIRSKSTHVYITLFFSFFLMASISDAAEDSQFHLNATQDIVYCDITPSFDQTSITESLQDGTAMRFSWHIVIEAIQSYWFNQQVADIHFNRHVMPDLLSMQWQLKDSLTDITSYTASLPQAIQFLSRIKHFPVIDKSLLMPHTSYLISVSLNIDQDDQNNKWWHKVFTTEHIIASSIIHLP